MLTCVVNKVYLAFLKCKVGILIAEVLQDDGVAEGGESQVIQHLNIMTYYQSHLICSWIEVFCVSDSWYCILRKKKLDSMFSM